MQGRLQSALEAAVNIGAGLGLSWALQWSAFPLIGVVITAGQSMLTAVMFTLASLLRSYAIRRLFVRLGQGRGVS